MPPSAYSVRAATFIEVPWRYCEPGRDRHAWHSNFECFALPGGTAGGAGGPESAVHHVTHLVVHDGAHPHEGCHCEGGEGRGQSRVTMTWLARGRDPPHLARPSPRRLECRRLQEGKGHSGAGLTHTRAQHWRQRVGSDARLTQRLLRAVLQHVQRRALGLCDTRLDGHGAEGRDGEGGSARFNNVPRARTRASRRPGQRRDLAAVRPLGRLAPARIAWYIVQGEGSARGEEGSGSGTLERAKVNVDTPSDT